MFTTKTCMTTLAFSLLLLATTVPRRILAETEGPVLNVTGLCDGSVNGLVTDYVLSVYAEPIDLTDGQLTNQLDIDFEVRTEFPEFPDDSQQAAVSNDWHVTIYYNNVQRLNTTQTSVVTELENGVFTEAELEVEVENIDYEAGETAVIVAMAMNKDTLETCTASITDTKGVLATEFGN